MSVVLRPVADPVDSTVAGTVDSTVAGTGHRFEVWADDREIGALQATVTGTTAHMAAELHRAPAVDADVFAFVVALVRQAQHDGATDVVLDTASLLLRDAARWAGFAGGLRVPLRVAIEDVVVPGPLDDRSRPPDRGERLASLVARLAALGVVSTPLRRARPVGRFTTKMAGGVGETMSVVVAWAPDRTFTVSVPDRFDIMPEPIALAAGITVGVLNRFPAQAAGVSLVSFDQALHEMKTGVVAGMTKGSSQAIHLNISYVVVEAFLEEMHRRDGPARPSVSARAPSPYTAVEATTAHELWHRVEMVFEARDYRASIELRRQLGIHLGVETLEQALKGATPTAPDAWRTAYWRLAREVSDYATTNPREATAEMFKLWWCRSGPPSPVVSRFGELIDELIPPS